MTTLVLYTFHKLNDNLLYFIRHGLVKKDNITFVLIGNCESLPINLPAQSNVKIYFRENKGFDFGAWSYGLLEIPEINYNNYEYFIFINQTVRGPFLPTYANTDWTIFFTNMINSNVKLAGTTIGLNKNRAHVQSMVMVTDKVGLQVGFENEIFSPKVNGLSKDEVINLEINYSTHILKKNYNIKCLLKIFEGIDFRKFDFQRILNIKYFDANYQYGYFGNTIHPYEVIFIKENRNMDKFNIEFYTQAHNRVILNGLCKKYIKVYDQHQPWNMVNFKTQTIFNEKAPNPNKIYPFNWEIYVLLNKDLQDAKIDTQKKAIAHWENHGKNENRSYNIYTSYPDFNWEKYISLNTDLAPNNINSEESATIHFLKYGRYENRIYN